jgi:hypothetical protein
MVSEGSGAGGSEDCRGSGFALRNCCTGPVCSQNLKLVRDADGNISVKSDGLFIWILSCPAGNFAGLFAKYMEKRAKYALWVSWKGEIL